MLPLHGLHRVRVFSRSTCEASYLHFACEQTVLCSFAANDEVGTVLLNNESAPGMEDKILTVSTKAEDPESPALARRRGARNASSRPGPKSQAAWPSFNGALGGSDVPRYVGGGNVGLSLTSGASLNSLLHCTVFAIPAHQPGTSILTSSSFKHICLSGTACFSAHIVAR